MNKEEIAAEIDELTSKRDHHYAWARRLDEAIKGLENQLRERCPKYDGVLRCELKEGHTGDHWAEYMGG